MNHPSALIVPHFPSVAYSNLQAATERGRALVKKRQPLALNAEEIPPMNCFQRRTRSQVVATSKTLWLATDTEDKQLP